MMNDRERITAGQRRILRHMLGMEGEPRRVWGYRNHYGAGRDGQELARLRGMEKVGLVRQGNETDKRIFFHATEAGCRAVGMNTLERQRALDEDTRSMPTGRT